MIIFFTTATEHLAPLFTLPQGRIAKGQWADGEWYVKIEQDVRDLPVLVVAATPAPSENIIELILLLDALHHAGAKIFLLMTYYGYARYDRRQHGWSAGAQVIASLLQRVPLEKFWIVHPHSARLHEFLPFMQFFPTSFFLRVAESADIIVAPDAGACAWVAPLAQQLSKPVICAVKERKSDGSVIISDIAACVKGKRVLIMDDMIATGNTSIAMGQLLHQKGAASMSVAATHGIFCADAVQRIEESHIENVIVTNTLPLSIHSSKITSYNIVPDLKYLGIF